MEQDFIPDVGADARGLGPDFAKLWWAAAISNLGDGVRVVALPLLAAIITRDPILVAGVTMVSKLPWLLVGVISGAVADQVDRRRLMIGSDVFRTVVIGLLGLLLLGGTRHLLLVYCAAFLLGSAETLFDNASHAIVPSLVARDRLEVANGRLEAVLLVNNEFLGPLLGGILFAAAVSLPFLLDSSTFAVSAVLLAAIPATASHRRRQLEVGRLRRDMADGVRWLVSHQVVRLLTGISAVANLCLNVLWGIVVLYALRILGLGEVGYGVLMAVFAFGGLLGSLAAARLSRTIRAGRFILLLVAMASAGLIVMGLASDVFLASAMLAVIGFAGASWNVVAVSMRQSLVPDELLGRVNGAYKLVAWGAMPLGALLGGVLADLFGLRAPFVIAGCILAALAVALVPAVGRLDRASPQSTPDH
jgi:MFS family permease